MRSLSLNTLPAVLAAVVSLPLGSVAHAQLADGETTPAAGSSVSPDATTRAQLDDLLARVRQLEAERDATTTATDTAPTPFVLGGYAEALYQWNFNDPSNRLTNFRGFDNRHNTFTLSNVALDATWDHVGLVARLTLQVGHTPSTYSPMTGL